MKECEETYAKSCEELFHIIKKNFYKHNAKFKEELLKALMKKTGNKNISVFISYIIDYAAEISQK